MKKNVLLAFAVFVSVLGSCNKAPTPDPELGEFQTCSSLINLSQKNKFNESLFCNKDWVLYGARYEKYHDGVSGMELTENGSTPIIILCG